MIVRTKNPNIVAGMVIDTDNQGYAYLKIPILPDMPFDIPNDMEIISPF